MGGDGLTQASRDAVLSANYLRHERGGACSTCPRRPPCMHEFVASARNLAPHGIKALDIAKGLLERGFYAPTIYFPLIVPEAIMIEPTETECKATLDAFADAVQRNRPAGRRMTRSASTERRTSLPVGRLDEVATARKPMLTLEGQRRADYGWKPAS